MSTLYKLEAELAKLAERAAKRRAESHADDERRSKIEAELHRLKLLPLVKIEAAVVLRFRLPACDKLAAANDVRGTITKMRRTRCLVEFPGVGLTNFPVDWLLPATEAAMQGIAIGGGK